MPKDCPATSSKDDPPLTCTKAAGHGGSDHWDGIEGTAFPAEDAD